MSDNGVLPDTTAGDGRYIAQINISNIQCLLVGAYKIQYVAQNSATLFSNLITSVFPVVNTANLPPVISNLIIPDSVVRPITGSFDLTISLTATDPDGSCDINSVYFDAFRSTGNHIGRIPMFPAGNNIYTFTNPVTPAVPDSLYGYYKYIFQAIDNSNALSNQITDSIKFVRP
jgi:hypothetical protein